MYTVIAFINYYYYYYDKSSDSSLKLQGHFTYQIFF